MPEELVYGDIKITRADEMRAMTQKLARLFKDRGYEPAQELIKSAQTLIKWLEETQSEVMRLQYMKELNLINKELLNYVYPKLKSIDVQSQIDSNITVTVGLSRVEMVRQAKALQNGEITTKPVTTIEVD